MAGIDDELDTILREVTGEFAAQYRLRNEAKEAYSIEIATRLAEKAKHTAKKQLKALLTTQQQELLDRVMERQQLYNVKSVNGVLLEPNTGLFLVPVPAIKKIREEL